MIQTQDVQFQYPSGTGFRFPDISLDDGDQLLVSGASGIGKSTLLKVLGLLYTPSQGKIRIENQATETLAAKQRDRFRGQHIGLVFQVPRFIQSLTVWENIEAKLFFAKKYVPKKDIEALLERLEIAVLRHQKTHQLSEGQKQRLSVAIATVTKPSLLLADEPTAHLDDTNARKAVELLQETADENRSNLIVVTHDHRIRSYFQNTLAL